jgi:hypothetical protein
MHYMRPRGAHVIKDHPHNADVSAFGSLVWTEDGCEQHGACATADKRSVPDVNTVRTMR